MSYSQYSHSGFTSAKADGTDSKTWTASSTIISNAVRYNWSGGNGWDIAFNTSGATYPHTWRDDSNTFPLDFSNDQITWYTGSSQGCPDAETIYLRGAGGLIHSFLSPQWQYSSANTSGSGDGTNTESVSTAPTEGSLAINNGVLTAFIPAYVQSGNFWIVEGSTPRNGFSHTVLTASFVVASGWSANNTSTWILQDGFGNELSRWPARKKVFCNFW